MSSASAFTSEFSSTSTPKWKVTIEPHGKNPGTSGENEGGVIVYLAKGSTKEEFSAVAWKRRASVNPHRSFKAQLRSEIADAQDVCDTLNDRSLL
jgi:hypothetical protein